MLHSLWLWKYYCLTLGTERIKCNWRWRNFLLNFEQIGKYITTRKKWLATTSNALGKGKRSVNYVHRMWKSTWNTTFCETFCGVKLWVRKNLSYIWMLQIECEWMDHIYICVRFLVYSFFLLFLLFSWVVAVFYRTSFFHTFSPSFDYVPLFYPS